MTSCAASGGDLVSTLYKLLHVWTVLLAISPTMAAGSTWNRRLNVDESQQQNNAELAPEFDEALLKEIHAIAGQTIVLPCTVRNLGDKVVSWIRTKDLHILTSGTVTFSADSRFEAVYNADFWGLRIRGVRISDTGQYECQVNTDPKMNMGLNLTVSDAVMRDKVDIDTKYAYVASIKGPKEVYVREGSPITFTCEIVSQTGAHDIFFPKPRVRWLYEGKEITQELHRGGISVDTDYRDRKVTSRLRVAMVTLQDGGLYTCSQAVTLGDSVRLFVVEAEHSEAMQRDSPASSSDYIKPPPPPQIILITMIVLLIVTTDHN